VDLSSSRPSAQSVPIRLVESSTKPTLAGPLPVPPERPPASVRRTSSIDMSWPGGPASPTSMLGRARDLLTRADGGIEVLAYDTMAALVSADRTIEEVSCEPDRPGVGVLVGARGGSRLRSAVDAALPDDRERHTPLALLFDDVAGASLVGRFAWIRQSPDWLTAARGDRPMERPHMVGICSGFRPGATSLTADGTPRLDRDNTVAVPPLVDPDDVVGWHPLAPLPEVAMRRARRMDVWRDGGHYRVDAHFRDSCSDPTQGEVAVHEYTIDATIDAASRTLASLTAVPRVLPFGECPDAAPNVTRLVGQSVAELRIAVLRLLTGTDCCTHLNDALRALADVAFLLEAVDRAEAS
jgi:hypothetical protein